MSYLIAFLGVSSHQGSITICRRLCW